MVPSRADQQGAVQQDGAEQHGAAGEDGGIRAGFGAPDGLLEAAQQNEQRDGGHDGGEAGLADERAEQAAFQQQAAEGAGDEGQRQAGPERQAEQADGGPDQEAAEHDQLALREVHDAGGAVDDDEGEGDEAVDEAGERAADDGLQQRNHAASSTSLRATRTVMALSLPSRYWTRRRASHSVPLP